jgi:hypothetical protein
MADRIQFILDKLTTSFQLLSKLNLFSNEELKLIVKQRTEHEYSILRREMNENTFRLYLNFELKLDKLLNLRKVKIIKSDTKKMYLKIQLLAVRHIIYIFERAVRRFPESDLWNDYIEFLKYKKCYTILSNLYGRVVALFPKKIEFWINSAVSFCKYII